MVAEPHSQISFIPNTLGLPCRARVQREAEDAAQVLEAARLARDQGLPLIALGEGSNVVLPPMLDACVVHIKDTRTALLNEATGAAVLRIGAGRSWHALVLESLTMGLYGLENLALIPGCVGAAPVQNIGAYGRELAEFVVAVHGVDLVDLRTCSLNAADCAFAYRDSVFKQRLRDRFVITAVDLRLSRDPQVNVDYPALSGRLATDSPTPEQVCDAVIALRRERLPDPAEHPNAGSFFKNPLLPGDRAEALARRYPGLPVYAQPDGHCKLSAAWLIDYCGLRGCARGEARVSERHALVIETRAGATQGDVLALADHVAGSVRREFDVLLEPEPRIYG